MGFTGFQGLIDAYNQGQRFRRRIGKTVNVRDAGWHSMWPGSGDPGAGGYTGTALNAVALDDTAAGAILHGGNVSALTKHLLRLLGQVSTGSSQVPTYLILYDRLLYYPQIDAAVATNQVLVNGVALPRYTDGVGVRAWLEITTSLGTGTGVVTFGDSGYTNSASVAGRQHGVTVNTAASLTSAKIPHSGVTSGSNWNPFLPLQAGDIGMKSVESFRFTSAHSAGVVALVLGRPIATISIPQLKIAAERDFLLRGSRLPRIYDGACLDFLFNAPASINSNQVYSAELDFVWG